MTKPIQGWKRCSNPHHDVPAVEPHLDFCFEHAPTEYRRAWVERDRELKAQMQKLIDFYGEEVFNWIRREMPGALRLPEDA
jgi:hypothetical protein